MNIKKIKGLKITGKGKKAVEDKIVKEEPLAIFINSSPYAVLMRTPGNEEELMLGFLFSERVIEQIEDIDFIHYCTQGKKNDTVVIGLKKKKIQKDKRAFEVRSSCGLCGKDVIDSLKRDLERITLKGIFPYKNLCNLDEKIRNKQPIFQKTGGTHAAGVFDKTGKLLFVREDIGRHNGLDKIIGHILKNKININDKLVFLTGRTSYEMILKSIRIGFPVVASISGTTSLAVELSKKFNVTLIGFLRGGSMNIYTHHWRIEKENNQ